MRDVSADVSAERGSAEKNRTDHRITDLLYLRDKGKEPRTFPDLWLKVLVVPFTGIEKTKICLGRGGIRNQEFKCSYASV